MANMSKKTIYIVVGIVILLVAIPLAILLIGFLAGVIFYFQTGAN